MKIKEVLGTNIRSLRKGKSLTQSELAELCDVSGTAIQHIETGRRWPSEKTISSIASALGVDEADLFVSHSKNESPLNLDIKSLIDKLSDYEINNVHHMFDNEVLEIAHTIQNSKAKNFHINEIKKEIKDIEEFLNSQSEAEVIEIERKAKQQKA